MGLEQWAWNNNRSKIDPRMRIEKAEVPWTHLRFDLELQGHQSLDERVKSDMSDSETLKFFTKTGRERSLKLCSQISIDRRHEIRVSYFIVESKSHIFFVIWGSLVPPSRMFQCKQCFPYLVISMPWNWFLMKNTKRNWII